MSMNRQIVACRDALIIAMRAAERASDQRRADLRRAGLDVGEYLEPHPTATIESADTAVSVLKRADAEMETTPPRTPAVRAALRKAVDRLQRIKEDNRREQPVLSIH